MICGRRFVLTLWVDDVGPSSILMEILCTGCFVEGQAREGVGLSQAYAVRACERGRFVIRNLSRAEGGSRERQYGSFNRCGESYVII